MPTKPYSFQIPQMEGNLGNVTLSKPSQETLQKAYFLISYVVFTVIFLVNSNASMEE